MGTRMNLEPPTNKCLLDVGGRSILEHSLSALESRGIRDVCVITGFCGDHIRDALKDRVQYEHNPHYETTGIIASIAKARETLRGKSFILMMGDLLYDPRMIDHMQAATGDIVVSYEEKSYYVPEDSKLTVDDDQVIVMGKHLNSEETSGEFGHMMYLSEVGSVTLFDEIDAFLREDQHSVYLMDVINQIIEKGTVVSACNITGVPRIEIDFQENLEEAKSHIFPKIEL